MNAMTGTHAAAPFSAQNLILQEMQTFEEILRRGLPAEAFVKANHLLTVLRDIFYYRGYLDTPGTNPEAFKNITQITPRKQQFSIPVGDDENPADFNVMDYLLKFIDVRIKSGDLVPGQIPPVAGRWIMDIKSMASGSDVPLKRSKFMGATADVVQLEPKPQAQPAPQPAPKPALSPADQMVEDQADIMEAALRQHGVAGGESYDFSNIAAQPRAVERAPMQPFILPEDDMIDLSFLDQEKEEKLLSDAEDEQVFRDNLAHLNDAIPVVANELSEEIPVTTSLPEDNNLDAELRMALAEDFQPNVIATPVEPAQEQQIDLPLETAPQPDEIVADAVEKADYVFERDIEIDMSELEATLMADLAQHADDEPNQKIQNAIEEFRAIAEDEPSFVSPTLTRRPVTLRTAEDESAEEIESARRLAEKFKPLAWPPRADYSKIEPTSARKAGFIAAATSFAMTTGLTLAATMSSRLALTAAATAFGAAALPAGIFAGIAVGAAHTYYKNRAEILQQAENVESRWERTKILTKGFLKCYTPLQFGLTLAGGFGGAYAADWIADNADWIAEKGSPIIKPVADATAGAFAWVRENVALAYNELTAAAPNTTVQADVTGLPVQADVTANPAMSEPKTIVVKTVPVGPDGVPIAAGAVLDPVSTTNDAITPLGTTVDDTLQARMVSDFTHVSDARSETVIAALKEQAQAMADAAQPTDVLVQADIKPLALDTVSESAIVDAAPATAEIAQTPVTTPDVLVAEDITATTAAPLQTTTHTVAKGDRNLWRIAQEIFGVKGNATQDAVEAIIAQNPELAADPSKIYLGQKLIIPVSLEEAPQAECKWSRRAVTCVIPSP